MDEGALTFEDFIRLPSEEQCERYVELSDHDKFRARISQPPAVGYVMCNDCVHYHKDVTCDAFPDGIPREIIIRGEHDTPFPGDNGIRFEPGQKW